ncbi:MAG TPA: beta/gamma crystallin domain-containing protein, partial [Ktedonobacteraceae bacterium]|nr:beta/gamma crystallin domain-containing protein [Ktedonobacteraceae bacterium]
HDFFKLWNATTGAGGVCFASDGGLSVNIFNVFMITSGSNAGFVKDHNGDIFCFGPNQTSTHFIAHVVFVDISGRTGSC